MTAQRWIRRGLLAGVALLSVGALGVVGPVEHSAPVVEAQAAGLGAGGEFHPLPVGPQRIFDSRGLGINDPAPGKKWMIPAHEFRVQIAGLGGLPANPSDILAVVANVTVAEPDAGGWLAVRPTGAAGGSSLVNFAPGRDVPNLAIVAVGADGTITVTLGPQQIAGAHVIIDVFGFISTSSYATPGARLVNMGPARLIDTREAGMGGPLGPGEVRPVQIRGARTYSPSLTIPNEGSVSAALVNILAVNNHAGNTHTFLSASPSPPARPVTTSNVNVVPGQIKANLAIVPVVDGNIYLYNHAGVTDMVIDVFGYFQTGPRATPTEGRVVPLSSPFRAIDTREAVFGNVPLGTGSAEDWSFNAFAKSVSLPGSGEMAQGSLIGNLTATDLRRVYSNVGASTFLTAYPGDVVRPLTSNLNLLEGEVVANMSMMPYGKVGTDDYVMKVYNHYGSTHYVLDVYAIVLD